MRRVSLDPAFPTTLPEEDLQETLPPLAIALTRAGITRSAKSIRMRDGEVDRALQTEISCSVDLGPAQKGVHMSRFEEVANAAIEDVLSGEATSIDILAERIATEIVARQGATRGDVRISAILPVMRRSPISDAPTQETYGLLARAVAGPTRARRILGVSAQGMNACPCAQGLLRDQAESALIADGFTPDEIVRILERVPIATHNQRARGTLYVGAPNGLGAPADALIAIVEEGMSSEIYELMKRTDERYVVDRAHRRPRFVEDSVREMVRGVLERFPDLPNDAFIAATQVNFETIHTHDVDAERTGTIGEIRSELASGIGALRPTTLDDWLREGLVGDAAPMT
ncbi:MAG: GTP cyclohydrolase I FolE2 [Actinobacteria bacterium]|nr:GTP cyclohydrolase I FolE2 [Actinomycetota bacterium]